MSQQQPQHYEIAASPDSAPFEEELQEDWEEWDGRSPFWIHCVAGSLAGVSEHTLVYPLDTVRTHIQVCASCLHKGKASPALSANPFSASNLVRSAFKNNAQSSTTGAKVAAASKAANKNLPVGMLQTIRFLVNEPAAGSAAASLTASNSDAAAAVASRGWSRLWLGVETILIGCIPAHALYFSSYELVKAATSTTTTDPTTGLAVTHVSPVGSSLAGAAAVLAHDCIMTPLDTLKQRLQLGHYNGSTRTALTAVLQHEGWRALYRSFPVTVAANVPYGMVMVSTNEFCKQAWTGVGERPTWQTVVAASSVGGFAAAAVTTPLDRIKTSLQTQQLEPVCRKGIGAVCAARVPRHATWQQAATAIWKQEGPAGFFRGVVPRVLSHTPAVAISWTTYETAKRYLLERYQQQQH